MHEWGVSGDSAVCWSMGTECVRVMLDYGLRTLVPLLPEPAAKPIRFRGGSEIAVVTWLFSIQQETKAHASERTGPERADRSTMNRDTCTRVDIRAQGERTPETNAREWTYGPRASEQVKHGSTSKSVVRPAGDARQE